MISVNPLDKKDLKVIINMWRKNTKKRFAHVNLRKQSILVAETNMIIGFVLVTPFKQKSIKVDAMLVDRSIENKDAVREALLNCAAREAKNCGKHLIVEIASDNFNLINLYKKFAFNESHKNIILSR